MSSRTPSRPPSRTPEEWLERADPEKTRGTLKLFLGYAPGVGKTYSMLSEAIRRQERGEDVLVGVVETHGRARTAELVQQLKVQPRKQLDYRGVAFEEMDLEGILARHPQIVLVDELAHTNIEGSRNAKRYEDVMQILAARIDVLSTLNVQHIESVAPTVQRVTGVEIRETVPDWVLQQADEVVMADLTPEALQERMRRGDIYPASRVERSLSNFFRRGNLIALRELALQHVSKAVDRTLTDYMDTHHIRENWAVRERILVCISTNPTSRYLIARGARLADTTDGELYILYVDDGRPLTDEQRRALDNNMSFARNLRAEVVEVKAKSVPLTAAAFTREKRITQVIFGRSTIHGLRKYFYYYAIQRFLSDVPTVDVHIVTQPERPDDDD
jgi:two-component system sensor histidine kinase KdpD